MWYHFQVDIPVVTAFRQAYDWADKFIYPDKNMAERWFIDLHSINEEILVNAGIKRENIENSNYRFCHKFNPPYQKIYKREFYLEFIQLGKIPH